MGIQIRTTFEIITPESAEVGEAAERGWIDETGTEYGFRELVALARSGEASSSARSYHPVSARDARYFAKALRAAGLWA